jgi:hypothetical protein
LTINQPWFSSYELRGPTFERVRATVCEQGSFPDRCRSLGGWFRSTQPSASRTHLRVLSPYHGRSAISKVESSYVAIKGIGWTWAPVSVMRSRKDQELTFGLLSYRDANREIEVSALLEAMPGTYSRVWGCAELTEIIVGSQKLDPRELVWSNGEKIRPALLYTEQLSPVRVADLLCLNDLEAESAIVEACVRRQWERKTYLLQFSEDLASTIAGLHSIRGVNDTLEPGNVTLCAEVTDFEWIHVPGASHPWPNVEDKLDERQSKELIYAIELIALMSSRLGDCHDESLALFLDTYLRKGGTAKQGVSDLRNEGLF